MEHNEKNEAPITLQFENAEIKLTRSTSSVYTYLGRQAMNHIWIEHSTDGETRTGQRIFWDMFGGDEETRKKFFGKTAFAMVNRGYQAFLNIQTPHPLDVDAYIEYETSKLDTENFE